MLAVHTHTYVCVWHNLRATHSNRHSGENVRGKEQFNTLLCPTNGTFTDVTHHAHPPQPYTILEFVRENASTPSMKKRSTWLMTWCGFFLHDVDFFFISRFRKYRLPCGVSEQHPRGVHRTYVWPHGTTSLRTIFIWNPHTNSSIHTLSAACNPSHVCISRVVLNTRIYSTWQQLHTTTTYGVYASMTTVVVSRSVR